MSREEIYDWSGEYAQVNEITARNYALPERPTWTERCRGLRLQSRHIDPTRPSASPDQKPRFWAQAPARRLLDCLYECRPLDTRGSLRPDGCCSNLIKGGGNDHRWRYRGHNVGLELRLTARAFASKKKAPRVRGFFE